MVVMVTLKTPYQIPYKGQLLSLYALSRITGLSPKILKRRYLSGLRGQRLVSRPRQTLRYNYYGEQLTISEIAARTGLSRSTISRRMRLGKTGDQLFSKKNGNIGRSVRKPNKLTLEQVQDIFIRATVGGTTQMAIAKEFSIDPSHVSDIKNGRRWSSVTSQINIPQPTIKTSK